MTVLEVSGLVKSYDAFRLGPIDLSVDDEVLAVLGPSGCGKTTLLSAIAGIVAPEAGSVALDGRRLDGLPPEQRGTVLVFQEGALFPNMTARGNVEYAAGDAADVEGLAETLEIGSVLDQRADTLSGGEAQRVALARALAADPDALLLDEPLANLDAPIRRRLRDDLRDLLDPLGVPVVYVTHDQTEASSVGDRVAVMAEGRVLQTGGPEAVFDRPATPFVAGFTGGANVFAATVDGAGRLEWGSYRLEVDGPDAPTGGADGDRPDGPTRETAGHARDVWFCLRPEHAAVEDVATGPPGDANAVSGSIVGRVFEAGTYRVTVRPDGVDATLEVAVLPPEYHRLDLGTRDRVSVRMPADAIHVIDGSVGGRGDEPGASTTL